jgi:hypothetical protein
MKNHERGLFPCMCKQCMQKSNAQLTKEYEAAKRKEATATTSLELPISLNYDACASDYQDYQNKQGGRRKGAGRKPTGTKTEPITLSIAPDVVHILAEIPKGQRSKFISAAIREKSKKR